MKTRLSVILIACGMIISSCHNDLWDAINSLDKRVSVLEEICKQMNTNISSIQTVMNVIQTNDQVASVIPITKDGEEVGYVITFTNHDPITIYHGTNGKDGKDGIDGKDGKEGKDGKDGKDGTNGTNGTDGITPIIGVAQDTDGVYYWTLNGEWLLDANNNKLRVTGQDGTNGTDGANGTNGTNGTNGVTPQLKIENDYWYVSYDNGATWTQLGKAKGDNGNDGQNGQDGDSMFQSVTQDENYVYFTLANGTVITVPKATIPEEGAQIVNGAILVPFSVSATKNVYFSQGNLQYNAMLGTHQCVDNSTKKGTWRFAGNQWDIMAEDNTNHSSSYNGWIDLFAWGTSGYIYKPDSLYQSSTSYSSNHLAISSDIEYTRHDWGYYNAISNADHSFEWRTLNHDEWDYLLSNHDWYLATVNNIKGMILLPDSYEEPTYIYHVFHDIYFAKYLYNIKTWKLLENQGAVFLPKAGQLSCSYLGTVSYGTETRVTYWTSSLYSYNASTSSSSYSYVMNEPASNIGFQAQELYYPVRLVRDVE